MSYYFDFQRDEIGNYDPNLKEEERCRKEKEKQLKRIQLGYEGPTDSCLLLDDKEYLIESNAWKLLSLIASKRINGNIKQLLDIIYQNFDEDLRIKI